MNEWILLSIFILGILIIVGLIVVFIFSKKKKQEKMNEINYQTFFSIGIIWIPVGIVFMIAINPAIGIAFMSIGLSYVVIGVANRDKWEKNK